MKKSLCFLTIIFLATTLLFSMDERNEVEKRKIERMAKEQTSQKRFYEGCYVGFIDFIRRQMPQSPFSQISFSRKPEDLRRIIWSDTQQAEDSNSW